MISSIDLRIAYLNGTRKEHLTRKNESRDPFSIYSTTIITGRPAREQETHTPLEQLQGEVLQVGVSSAVAAVLFYGSVFLYASSFPQHYFFLSSQRDAGYHLSYKGIRHVLQMSCDCLHRFFFLSSSFSKK